MRLIFECGLRLSILNYMELTTCRCGLYLNATYIWERLSISVTKIIERYLHAAKSWSCWNSLGLNFSQVKLLGRTTAAWTWPLTSEAEEASLSLASKWTIWATVLPMVIFKLHRLRNRSRSWTVPMIMGIGTSAQCLKIIEKVLFNIPRLHFEWPKVNQKRQKWSLLTSFYKTEACGQTVLPDKSLLKRQKLVGKAKLPKIKNKTFWVIFKQYVTVWESSLPSTDLLKSLLVWKQAPASACFSPSLCRSSATLQLCLCLSDGLTTSLSGRRQQQRRRSRCRRRRYEAASAVPKRLNGKVAPPMPLTAFAKVRKRY